MSNIRRIKIEQCREHWTGLTIYKKSHSKTAKHLIAAVLIAEQLQIENNKMDQELIKLRIEAEQCP